MILFLAGASGAGKTTLLKKFQNQLVDPDIACFYFDDIGIPSESEMIAQYGSGKAWQKAATEDWINKVYDAYQNKKLVILEGQTDLSFIAEACRKRQIADYKIILVHCSSAMRHKRLLGERNQPELIHADMDNWAEFLKSQAISMNAIILDISSMNIEQSKQWLEKYVNDILKKSNSAY